MEHEPLPSNYQIWAAEINNHLMHALIKLDISSPKVRDLLVRISGKDKLIELRDMLNHLINGNMDF
jgi:hypothetical protein